MLHPMTQLQVERSFFYLVPLHAGLHRDLLLLPQRFAGLHGAMTGGARDTGTHVFPVTEEDKVWKLVNPSPGNGFVFFLEACQFLNRRALALDGLVTAHTVSGVRNLRHIACGCRGMANATFQAELAVLLVTERNRLRLHFGRNCHVGGFAPGPGRDDSGFSSTKNSWAVLPL